MVEKVQDLRRLEAQRNELNDKGMDAFANVASGKCIGV